MGFLTSILGRIYKPAVNKALKGLVEELESDPEVTFSIAEYQRAKERARIDFTKHCAENPDSWLCTESLKKIYNPKG